MSTERAELVSMLEHLKPAAAAALRRYARTFAPHVPAEFVEAVGHALGDISFDEAIAGIDQAEREATR